MNSEGFFLIKIIKSPNHQILKSSNQYNYRNHQIVKLPNHQITSSVLQKTNTQESGHYNQPRSDRR